MDQDELRNILSGATALMSLLALVYSVRAQRKSYALDKSIAEQAGRLRAVIFAKVGLKPKTHDLIPLNGPTETTVRSLALVVRFHLNHDTLFRRREVYKTSIESALDGDFDTFGVHGPALPVRLAPYEHVVWQLDQREDDASLRFCVELVISAEVLGYGLMRSEPAWLICKPGWPWFVPVRESWCSGSLLTCVDGFPAEVRDWILGKTPAEHPES